MKFSFRGNFLNIVLYLHRLKFGFFSTLRKKQAVTVADFSFIGDALSSVLVSITGEGALKKRFNFQCLNVQAQPSGIFF